MAGTHPTPELIETLVVQCETESDFFVRDMLTWALIRNDHKKVIARITAELDSRIPQARSQALHTLTKIGDQSTYPLVSKNLMFDSDDIVAMTAWRAASLLVPENQIKELIPALLSQLGRGSYDVQIALSKCLCNLGEAILEPLREAGKPENEVIQEHVSFTLKLYKNPEFARKLGLDFAERVKTLKGAPVDLA